VIRASLQDKKVSILGKMICRSLKHVSKQTVRDKYRGASGYGPAVSFGIVIHFYLGDDVF
jgi:hypothetical protein